MVLLMFGSSRSLLSALVLFVLLFWSSISRTAGEASSPYHSIAAPKKVAPHRRGRIPVGTKDNGSDKNLVPNKRGRQKASPRFENRLRNLFQTLLRPPPPPPSSGSSTASPTRLSQKGAAYSSAARQLYEQLVSAEFELPDRQWAISLGPPGASSPEVPVVRLLYQIHSANPANSEIRDTLLHMLRIGLDPNANTEATNNEPPLTYRTLLNPAGLRYDVELVASLLEAGASTDPVLYGGDKGTRELQARERPRRRDNAYANVQRPAARKSSPSPSSSPSSSSSSSSSSGVDQNRTLEGASLLHLIAFPHQTAVITQAFIQEVFASLREGYAATVEEAMDNVTTQISGNVAVAGRSRWAVRGLRSVSPTLRALADHWNSRLPANSFVGQPTAQSIVEEWAVHVFRLLEKAKTATTSTNRTGYRNPPSTTSSSDHHHHHHHRLRQLADFVSEMGLALPQRAGGRNLNIFHICAQKGWGTLLAEMRRVIVDRLLNGQDPRIMSLCVPHSRRGDDDASDSGAVVNNAGEDVELESEHQRRRAISSIRKALLSVNECCSQTPLHLAARWTSQLSGWRGSESVSDSHRVWNTTLRQIRQLVADDNDAAPRACIGEMEAEACEATSCTNETSEWTAFVQGAGRNDALVQLLDLAVVVLPRSALRSALLSQDASGKSVLDWLSLPASTSNVDVEASIIFSQEQITTPRNGDSFASLDAMRDERHRIDMCQAVQAAVGDRESKGLQALNVSCQLASCRHECLLDHLKAISSTTTTSGAAPLGPQGVHPAVHATAAEESDGCALSDVRVSTTTNNNSSSSSNNNNSRETGAAEQCPPRYNRGRCDFVEVEGWPSSHAAMASLLMRDQPIVFRNGTGALGIPRELWSPSVFAAVHRNISVAVSQIENRDPGGRGNWQASVADAVVQQPLGEFLGKASCHEKHFVRVRLVNETQDREESATALGTSAGKTKPAGTNLSARVLNERLPDILSSSDTYTSYPQLLYGMTAATDFLRRVPGVNIPRAGNEMHGLELAARVFVSCAGDGRSMHYHEMALNTLTFGRKRWAVLPPHHAHFSTQMGSLLFAELDTGARFNPPPVLDTGNASSVNEFAKAEAEIRNLQPLQCIQEAGDIVLVPALWSHATLSLEACYAFATFLDFEPVFSPLDEEVFVKLGVGESAFGRR